MREIGEGNIRLFAVDSKSFEIVVEGEGGKLKGSIMEHDSSYVQLQMEMAGGTGYFSKKEWD